MNLKLALPLSIMHPKTVNFLKIITFLGLSTMILFIVFGKQSGEKNIPEQKIIEDSQLPIVPVENSATLRDSIIDYAMELIGKPYVEGGCSKDGFDCSGFVYYVFQHFRVQVPRSSSQYQNFGKTVPLDSVRKGDVLVFLSPTRNEIGHVGIVTKPNGKETEFIHSSSGPEMEVIITSLKREGYTKRFVKAVNVLGKK